MDKHQTAKTCFLTVLTLFCLTASGAVMAIDPGKAKGTLTNKTENIRLSYAYAWHHDGKELGNPGWRILLTDREVPLDLLAGPIALLPSEWAKTGRLKGVLIRNDTRKPARNWKVQVLLPQSPPQATLENLPFKLGPDKLRLAGSIDLGADKAPFAVKANFDAPVFHDEAVTAVLTGRKAQKSAQATVLAAFNEAWRHTDWDTLARYATADMLEAMRPVMQAHQQDFAKASSTEKKQLAAAMLAVVDNAAQTRASITRIVIRGRRAVMMRRKLGPQAMRLEDSGWKVDF